MRLVLILIFGLIAISATYAWSNLSSGQAQANKIEQVSKIAEGNKIAQFKTITTPINANSNSTSTATHTAKPAASSASTAAASGNANGSTGIAGLTNTTGTTETPPAVIDGHATTLDAARITARSSAGKSDPFTPLDQVMKEKEPKKTTSKIPAFATGLSVPPPPPGVTNPFGTHDEVRPGQLNSGLDLGELPMPPDNAGINHKVELVGIVGDRAIFAIKDSLLRRRHHWPRTFTLAIGQSFENLKLKAIKDESAVVEEDGQTFSKQMPVIK
jgi:hypothetical protein